MGTHRITPMGCRKGIRKQGIENGEKYPEVRPLRDILIIGTRETSGTRKIFQDLITEENNSDGSGAGGGGDSDDEFKTNHTVEFKDQKTLEYQEIIAQGGKISKLTSTSYLDLYSQISDDDSDDGDQDDQDGGDTPPHPQQQQHHQAPAPAPAPIAPTHRRDQLTEVNIDDI